MEIIIITVLTAIACVLIFVVKTVKIFSPKPAGPREIEMLAQLREESALGYLPSVDTAAQQLDAEIRSRTLALAGIDQMPGLEFERYVGRLLASQGYQVEVTRASGDFGADIVAIKEGYRFAVQVKRYEGKVPGSAVSQAVASMAFYECDWAMVVTNSHFTPGAIRLAKANQCRLVDRDALQEWISAFQREDHDATLGAASAETERALELAHDRPPFWQLLLTEQLLTAGLEPILHKRDEIEQGLFNTHSRSLGGAEFRQWLDGKMNRVNHLVVYLKVVVERDLTVACGSETQRGQPAEIKAVIDKLLYVCDELLGWEVDLRAVRPPAAAARLVLLMQGWASMQIRLVEQILEQLSDVLRHPNKGIRVIEIAPKAPYRDEAMTEARRLQQIPDSDLMD